MRREKYKTIVDVVSQSNIRRLFDQDPDQALEKDEFLKMLRDSTGDVEKQREILRGSRALKYDFRQHWDRNYLVDEKVPGKVQVKEIRGAQVGM